jgi:outer membrane lipoprotein-sorting protein
MKRFVVLTAMLTVFTFAVSSQDALAQSAVAIMERAKELRSAQTMSTRSRMVITAKDGSTTERMIDQYAKDDARGNARAVIVFQSPATVRGTRFLTMDNASGKSDQWIFLPAIGKVRRIAASESGGNFMGTDFSYDDMAMMDRDTDRDTHTILREESLNGTVCYVIQSVPRSDDYQYSKTISWIDKENYRVYKSELYNRRGILLKMMEMSAYTTVQGHDTPAQTRVSTVAAGTSTTIYMDIIKYDDPIPEGVFTTAYIETGRAR